MAQYYNPKRSADWNYGGSKFKLSRSKIELFMKCPRCFYIDNKLGVARPRSFPLNLNSAVDKLLKKEFDIHRAEKSLHPLMDSYGLDLVPFDHKDMDTWREVFEGVQYFHEPSGLTISGAVDDIWVTPKGELVVVDYKSTSKEEQVNLDADWQVQYKRQLEIYQWLLRRKGFKVSDTGYFVYANGRTDLEAFDGKLEFEVTLIPYTGSDKWVEGTIMDIKKCLDGGEIPAAAADCEYCRYIGAVNGCEPPKKLSAPADKAKAEPRKRQPKDEPSAGLSSLF
ncbi:MAG TPA: PD-(D/E)XK nuclease family protein [Candidatus Paceibacterota bacterium]|jgi:CRISPR/Cas system-associated exonuclease Cas4 (RecB family)|nr:PD-(D/E)XK nuclease family protein [Candidatus Paceibacterota bacterium]